MSSIVAFTLSENWLSPPPLGISPRLVDLRRSEEGAGQEQEDSEKKRKKRKMAAPSADNTRTGTVMTMPLCGAINGLGLRSQSMVFL